MDGYCQTFTMLTIIVQLLVEIWRNTTECKTLKAEGIAPKSICLVFEQRNDHTMSSIT